MQKLSNKQSTKVIGRFDRFRISEYQTARNKKARRVEKLLTAHTLNCIELRVNPGLLQPCVHIDIHIAIYV